MRSLTHTDKHISARCICYGRVYKQPQPTVVIMLPLSEHSQISCELEFDKVVGLGIALRIKAPFCPLNNTAIRYRKLKQDVNSCWQHIEGAWNSNRGIFFVQNSVTNRRKLPAVKLLALLILCLSCGNVDCRLHRTLHNVAERFREQVFMSCASNNTVHPCHDMVWTHYTAHTLVPNTINQGDNVSPLVSHYISIVQLNNGKCNLEIKIQTSAEGTYECTSPSTGITASASLIILSDYPECLVKTVVNKTGEYSNITCRVEYFGDWAPTMEWITMIGQNRTSISSSQSYTSDQIVSANLVVPRNASAGYMCIMKFTEQGRKTKTTATNVPDYEWTSLVFGEYEGEARRKETTESMPSCKEINSGSASNKTAIILGIVIPIVIIIGIAIIWKIWRRRREDVSIYGMGTQQEIS